MPPKELCVPFYWENVSQNLNTMRKNSVLTDVVLSCRGMKFEAHRSHLSASSEYFYKLFNSGFKETVDTLIEFPSIEPDGLSAILDILYTGVKPELGFFHTKQIVVAAHLMQLHDIFLHYREQFLSQLCRENFMVFWDVGETLQDDRILQAVYNIAEEFYVRIEFLSISSDRMRDLFRYLVQKEYTSHDLLFKILVQWVSGFQGNRKKDCTEFLSYIDFQKLSSCHLAEIFENSQVMESEILRNKIFTMSFRAFQYVLNLESANVLNNSISATIFVFGKNNEGQYLLQKCRMGQWGSGVFLQEMTAEEATAIFHQSELYVVAKETKSFEETEACLTVFDSEGHKKNRFKLGQIPNEAKIVATHLSNAMAITGYVKNYEYNFLIYFNKVTESLLSDFESDRTIKLELLSDGNNLYQVSQEEMDHGSSMLVFWQFSLLRNEWYELGHFHFKEAIPNWFAYLVSPNIFVRLFPGRTVCYNTEEETFRQREECNDLTGVVSLTVIGNAVWCLTREGCLYVQETKSGGSKWKYVTKTPVVLKTYKQVILVD